MCGRGSKLLRFSIKAPGLVMALVLGTAGTFWAQQQKRSLEETKLVEKVGHSVVFLLADGRAEGKRTAASGSGFVLDRSGLAVTNYHVIEAMCGVINKVGNGTAITVATEGGQNLGEPEIVASNKKRDLALLRLPGKLAPGVPLGDSDQLHLGQVVISLGYPWSFDLGFNLTFTEGNLSAIRKLDGMKDLQHSASTAPGSSGGPLLNTFGEAIGVNFAGFPVNIEGARVAREGNVNWAIPSNDVHSLLAQQGQPPSRPLRAFCGNLEARQEEAPTAPMLIYQSEPRCLYPGSQAQFSGDLQAGRTYVFLVKRLQGSAKLVFGVGTGPEDFRGTDQERQDGTLLLPYQPSRTGTYTVIVGATAGGERTCFLLALFVIQTQGQ